MLEDDSFKLDSDRIRAAVEVAKKVQLWAASNETEVAYFEEQLLKHMHGCMSDGLTSVARREKVWGSYYRLRVSKAYRNFWKVFLTVVGCKTTDDPIFPQHISHNIIIRLMKDTFPLPKAGQCSSGSSSYQSLAFEETNAIRYVARYVCAKLYKKLKKSSA